MASFFVIQGPDQGRRFELPFGTTLIGRDPTNLFRLQDAEVSRRHAKVHWDGSDFVLLDLDSVNGVRVNHNRIRKHCLSNGDSVLLGKTLLLFTARPSEVDSVMSDVVVRHDDQEGSSPRIIEAIASDSAVPMTDWRLFADDAGKAERINAHLKMMYHTTLVVSQTLDIGVLLNRILDLIFDWVNVDRGCILLFDPETHQLAPKATRLSPKASHERGNIRFEIGKSILDYVRHRREGVLIDDAQKDEHWNVGECSVREVICVPMQGRYGPVGMIYIDTLRLRETGIGDEPGQPPSGMIPRLTGEHLRMMVAIAHQAALAVEDTRFYRSMVQSEQLAAVGQTVTTLSHHIKNILQGISGGSHLIQTGLSRHDESLIDKGWKIVEKNQTRISRLILDMLTFSKEREPTLAVGSIQETLGDVLELMQGQADEYGIRLLRAQPVDIQRFRFDAEQIHRAITNIVLNAIEAVCGPTTSSDDDVFVDPEAETASIIVSEKTGVVHVLLDFDEKRAMVRIVVDDDGPGVLPSDRERLFRPFQSNKRCRGTGLGIPIADKIFKEHGGDLRIEDSPLGGARFIMELPLNVEP